MNSAVSDSNWRAVSEEHQPPAIRATALADFHTLVLSVTRRLLSATLYVTEARIRTRSSNDARRRANPRIRVEDVTAAASSLGMKHTSGQFWAQCARRLQLNVVDDRTEDGFTDEEDEDEDTSAYGSEDIDSDNQLNTVKSTADDIEETDQETEESEEEDSDFMSYNEVEALLGFPVVDSMRNGPSTPEAYMSSASDYITSTSEETDEEDQREEDSGEDSEYGEDIEMKDREGAEYSESDDGLNLIAIKRDMDEAMISFVPLKDAGQDTTPTPRTLRSRIRAEYRLERDAERRDLQASINAEAELWAILRGDDDQREKGHKS
ncbi:hypothetical protein ONZ43_g6101 [Nemania bipapillata]|uniref:Uncharacterized protein n=1 Tax=Nemania bipapillata TaxID=110536 RepID=A0ACC2I2J7_9PEZI|nr:hypothetical protein ONZ43_g6101 [Nemania bipapillata]